MPGQGRQPDRLTVARRLALLAEMEDGFAAARGRVAHLPREADPRLVAAATAQLSVARQILDRLWRETRAARRRRR